MGERFAPTGCNATNNAAGILLPLFLTGGYYYYRMAYLNAHHRGPLRAVHFVVLSTNSALYPYEN